MAKAPYKFKRVALDDIDGLPIINNAGNELLCDVEIKEKPKTSVVVQKDDIFANIWSTRQTTREDNAATIQLLNIVNNEPYSSLSLNSDSKMCTEIWEIIYSEMKIAGFEVAADFVQGGKICRQMWEYLNSEFFSVEKTFKETESVTNNQRLAQQQWQVMEMERGFIILDDESDAYHIEGPNGNNNNF